MSRRAPPDRTRTARASVLVGVVAAVALVGGAALPSAHGAGPALPPGNGPVPGPGAPDAAVVGSATAPPPTASPEAPGVPVPSGQDASDPFLTVAADRYLLFTSDIPATPPVNVPVATSADFTTWTRPTDALPALPAWAVPGFTWAPDVHRFGSTWVLYFTALLRGTAPPTQCIGSAVADAPTGPFLPGAAPFICQLDQGGSIDPRVFVDGGGTPWMVWKSDQNIGGAAVPTRLWSQPLSPDGLHLLGTASLLMGPDRPWQGTIVEAPDLVEIGGAYWLVYSANWFNQPAYAVGAARCAGPAGPCADVAPGPLLASNAQGEGPGEASVFRDTTGVWLVYTPWRSSAPRPDWPPRPVDITRLGFGPTGPYLAAGGPPQAVDLLGVPLWSRGG